MRQEKAARREFIDDLLYGRSDLGRLAERAERFGLLLSHAHAVAVVQGPEPYDDGYAVTRTVEPSLVACFGNRRILLTTKDVRLICVAPADEPDVLTHFAKQAYAATDGGRVAVGRAHPGAGGVVHSYEEARGGAKPLLDPLTAYFPAGCVTAQAARSLSLSVRATSYVTGQPEAAGGRTVSGPVAEVRRDRRKPGPPVSHLRRQT
ncbi:hypothetical protein GCM10017752_62320 [Streptomyces roseoviridis]